MEGNGSNIYKHEIYISTALPFPFTDATTAAAVMMLYVYGDSLGLILVHNMYNVHKEGKKKKQQQRQEEETKNAVHPTASAEYEKN